MPYSPPRFWWLRRLSLLTGAMLIGFIALHWWLTARVEARIEGIVDGWRQQPGAPLPEHLELLTGMAPDDGNAAFYYRRAFASLSTLTQQQVDEWYDREVPLSQETPYELIPPDHVELVREIVQQDAAALQIAREARAFSRADWGLPVYDLVTATDWRELRELALRIRWAAQLELHDGEIASAVERYIDIHHLSGAAVENGPSIVAGLIATGISAYISSAQLRTIAWHAPPGMTEDQQRQAWREAEPAVRRAIAALLDEEFDRRLIVRSWQGERVTVHGAAGAAMAMLGGPPVPTLRFVHMADLARTLEKQDRIVLAALEADYTELLAQSGDAPLPDTIAGAASALHPILGGSLEHLNISFLRGAADRRMAAVLLAARLFHLDHNRWPQSLEEMAPDYLPHVPADPFAPGQPLGFRADTSVPIVYSIGENLVDDGGSTASLGPGPLRTRATVYDRRDLVYPLHLPEAYFAHPRDFNVWNYLLDPADELARAPAAAEDRREVLRKAQSSQ